jgi:D-alanyl-D-alanine carboxypeptidase/D-alanyl-D-alanine-endopeptidase (penicillin-binding protein 4)
MRQLRYLFGLALLIQGCSLQTKITKELRKSEADLHHHVGFYLWDEQKEKAVARYQEDRYFTPASNTKILTLFAAAKILGDSLPAFRYVQRNDSVLIWPMGDPSFLYPAVHQNPKIYEWLRRVPGKLVFSDTNFYSERFGPGWAWSDFAYDYSPERTPFPIYGNLITVQVDDRVQTIPVVPVIPNESIAEPITRAELANDILIRTDSSSRGRWSIPLHYTASFLIKLLSDTLHRPVYAASLPLVREAKIMKSIPADSAYKVLMQASDNMIAEQLLLQCGSVLADSLQTEITIKHIQQTAFVDLPDPVRWVDGSGLSRYNQFTPRSIVTIWRKLDAHKAREQLLPLLATGGKSGTIRNYYKNERPYIFGKTGSLSNNHCLSGYLVTRKGKTLFFSYMNSGFVAPTARVRERMEKVLKLVHDTY